MSMSGSAGHPFISATHVRSGLATPMLRLAGVDLELGDDLLKLPIHRQAQELRLRLGGCGLVREQPLDDAFADFEDGS